MLKSSIFKIKYANNVENYEHLALGAFFFFTDAWLLNMSPFTIRGDWGTSL